MQTIFFIFFLKIDQFRLSAIIAEVGMAVCDQSTITGFVAIQVNPFLILTNPGLILFNPDKFRSNSF